MTQSVQNKEIGGIGAPRYRLALIYGAMLASAVAIFLIINHVGLTLNASESGSTGTAHVAPLGGKPDALVHVLVALTAVLICGRLVSVFVRRLGQPPVIGEVAAGILLGPSFLGWIWPGAAAFVLPPMVAPYLGVIAQLGVILYMFLVGLELNAGFLRQHAHVTVAISHASIVAPFLLGGALALVLYPRYSTSAVPFTSFALFVGVAMAITAFPVLARILTDRRMQNTQLGTIAIACAATDDVTAWCLLAFVVGVAQAHVGDALLVSGLALIFIGFMFIVVRPLASRFASRINETQITSDLAALVFATILLAALATEAIGVHAIFGAFLLGAVIPNESALAASFKHKLEDTVTVLLLPAFFAFTGMRTQIGLLSGWEHWLMCGLIILVATAGKFGGSYVAARLNGYKRPEAAALGILMNTRGLMELIVLNIGLDLKVITPTVFAMMVLMALVTTVATTPVLQMLAPALAYSEKHKNETRGPCPSAKP